MTIYLNELNENHWTVTILNFVKKGNRKERDGSTYQTGRPRSPLIGGVNSKDDSRMISTGTRGRNFEDQKYTGNFSFEPTDLRYLTVDWIIIRRQAKSG